MLLFFPFQYFINNMLKCWDYRKIMFKTIYNLIIFFTGVESINSTFPLNLLSVCLSVHSSARISFGREGPFSPRQELERSPPYGVWTFYFLQIRKKHSYILNITYFAHPPYFQCSPVAAACLWDVLLKSWIKVFHNKLLSPSIDRILSYFSFLALLLLLFLLKL